MGFYTRSLYFLCAFLFLVSANAQPAQGGLFSQAASYCGRLLQTQPTDSYTFEDWQQAFAEAEKDGNITGGAFALGHMLRLKQKELGISWRGRRALKAYARALATLPPSLKGETDQSNLPVDPLYHKIKTSQRVVHYTGKFVRHFLWSFGPFGYRLFPYFLTKYSTDHLVRDLQNILINESTLQNVLGLQRSPFLEEITAQIFQNPTTMRTQIGKAHSSLFLGPASILAFSLLTGMATETAWGRPYYPHPLHHFSTQHPAYIDMDFIADAEQHTGRTLSQQRISYIVDRNLVTDALRGGRYIQHLFGNIDPTTLIQAREIRSRAQTLTPHVVSSLSDFRQALEQSRNADVVFIVAHGSPGDFTIGASSINSHIQELPAGVLRNGALLIFISCSFGDQRTSDTQPAEHETWVRFSRQVFQDSGVAVAATNDLMFVFVPSPTNGVPLRQTLQTGAITLLGLPSLALERFFIGPTEDIRDIQDNANHQYGHGRPGLRVYRQVPHQPVTVRYYQHQ